MTKTLYENIKTERRELGVSTACGLLGVSRNWYNAWAWKASQARAENDPLCEPIHRIKKENHCYGYRRITAELHRQGIIVNHKRVLKTMRKHGLTRRKRCFRVCTTNSGHGLRTYPDLAKGLEVTRLDQVWVADITYVRLASEETTYLATLMDRFSRRFLGWQLSYDIDTRLCLDALEKALKQRQGTDLTGLIHHSDQGVQYASSEYIARLGENGIKPSMARKGNPYDNAHIESAIKTIKCEEVYMDEYRSFSEAYKNIKRFIEEVYNKKRLHSSIGYMPPAEFEEQYKLKEVLA